MPLHIKKVITHVLISITNFNYFSNIKFCIYRISTYLREIIWERGTATNIITISKKIITDFLKKCELENSA